MKRQTAEIAALHERASATPERKGSGALGKNAAVSSPGAVGRGPVERNRVEGDRVDRDGVESDRDASLRGRQLRFAHALTTPESQPGPLDDAAAARWLTAGPRMTALERLEIYRRSYHARLVDCLVDDYPAVQHALVDAPFEALCRDYIAAFPSTGPNLNHFGRRMSAFVAERAPEPFPLRAFAADLAALEWAIVEVIHAPGASPLTLEGLRDVPPDAWGELRFEATPAFRLLRFGHPVNEYFQAFRDGESPSIPGGAPSATVVYRSESTMWRMDLTEPMAQVLSALVAGEPLGEALARAEGSLSHLDEAELAARVTAWFREWVAHGLFVRARW
jgi:hypothetical protein